MTPEGDNLTDHILELQERLAEAEETLRALRSGEVDAVVASGPDGDRVYTLKGADEAYRVMVQNMADGALTATHEGLILFANQQFASMLGMPLERVIGSSIHDFIVAEDAAMLGAVLACSTARTAEVQLRKASDVAVPVQLSAVPLVLDAAECICVNVTDLTEQKRNQQIVAAERLARSILDQAAGAIVVLDGSGKIIRASRAAKQLADGIVLLRQFDEVFCLYDSSAGKNYGLAEILAALERDGTVAGLETTVRRADGQTCEVLLSASRLTGPESEFLGCTVLLSDVSGIRQAEAALRESELRLRTLGDNLPEGAIYRHSLGIDGTMRFEFVSAGIERLTGVPAAEIMRDATALERTLIPEDSQSLRAALALSGERLTRFEIEIRHTHRATGELRWSLLRSVPSRRADGTTMWDGIQLDITERKNSEAVIQHKQKLESIGLLAGGIAHDFNNILTVIIGNAGAALEDPSDSEYPRSILSAAERAANLTKQLLAYAGKGNVLPKQISLTEHVSEARDLLRASVPKRVSLEYDLSPDLPWLQADPSQLEQILLNLVINAGESIPPQSDGSIRIATRGVEFTPEMARLEPTMEDQVEAGMYVCLEVSDNGAGIDQATLSRIFDPFFTTKFAGRGLGLAAVQGIVRASRGFIRVQSLSGEGTTFQVFLPAAVTTPNRNIRTAAGAPTASLQGCATVLVVDDEATIRKFVRRSLQRYGYTVLEAENGGAALEILSSGLSRPDIVLLDFAMPVMGGDELLPILTSRFPGLKVICSSGYPQEESLRSPASLRVSGFLQKPYTVSALAEKIKQALEQRS